MSLEKLNIFGANEDKFKHLKNIGLVVTHRCNMDCDFCIWRATNKEVQNKNNLDIDLNLFEKILKDGKEFGYKNIMMTGGECCMHPRFKELINLIIKYEMSFTFVSNAKQFEKYKFLFENKKIIKYFLGFAISLDGNEKIHDSKRGIDSYKKVLKFLDYCKSKNFPMKKISLKCAISQHNYKYFMHVIKIGYSYGVDVEIFDVVCASTLKPIQYKEVYQIIEDNEKFLKKILKKIRLNMSLLTEVKGYGFCNNFSNLEFNIHPDGRVLYCCGMDFPEFEIGNIKTDNIRKILKKKMEKTAQIFTGLIQLWGDIDCLGVVMKDRCSLCRAFLGCKQDDGNVNKIIQTTPKKTKLNRK